MNAGYSLLSSVQGEETVKYKYLHLHALSDFCYYQPQHQSAILNIDDKSEPSSTSPTDRTYKALAPTTTTTTMQYSVVFLCAMAATGSLAAPQSVQFDDSINVMLQNQAIELGSGTSFVEGARDVKSPVGSSGPFETVELSLGPDVSQQTLRCQILDGDDEPIVVVRGENVETTFADGDGGPWTLRDGAQVVESIICDPEFVKSDAEEEEELDLEIRVTLSDGNLATQTAFAEGGLVLEEQDPVGSPGPYDRVTLRIGADVQQDIRCQIVDDMGHAIELSRGENQAFTFADGGKGEWIFLEPASSLVDKIICDPAF